MASLMNQGLVDMARNAWLVGGAFSAVEAAGAELFGIADAERRVNEKAANAAITAAANRERQIRITRQVAEEDAKASATMEAALARETAAREANAAAVQSRIGALTQELITLRSGEKTSMLIGLEDQGATSAQLDQAASLYDQVEAIKKAQEAAADEARRYEDALKDAAKVQEDIQGIIDDIGRSVEEYGMSEAEIERRRLQNLGATEAQLAEFDRRAAELQALKDADKDPINFGAMQASILTAVAGVSTKVRKEKTPIQSEQLDKTNSYLATIANKVSSGAVAA